MFTVGKEELHPMPPLIVFSSYLLTPLSLGNWTLHPEL